MAAINDLIAQIEDSVLRDRIQAEVNRMNKQKKFGLVFEEHLPECTPLYDIPVKKGSLVAKKNDGMAETYTVQSLDDKVARCFNRLSKETEIIALDELVSVAEFGDPIYPYLKPIDSVCNAPNSKLWHILIEADNYHALQLLEYLYAGKVDCIYIDPPYNTGAKDWKYNNDYVDSSDQFRHSKWLSMMEKRIRIAKRLLKPTGFFICAIDNYELYSLGMLLDEIFNEHNRIGQVTVLHNPKGRNQSKFFSANSEFFLVYSLDPSNANFQKVAISEEVKATFTERDDTGKYRWESFIRARTVWAHENRPDNWYPIFVSKDRKIISSENIQDADVLYPVTKSGEFSWKNVKTKFDQLNKNGYFRVIEENGKLVLQHKYYEQEVLKNVWLDKKYQSEFNGTNIVKALLDKNVFDYPKSLYLVEDIIKLMAGKDALILDFFAGSGTTLHAVNLLNDEDGGHRRCIMVTNNEVSDTEAKKLTKQGFKPGDKQWEELGIARYVTWPRTVSAIKGISTSGKSLKGIYISSNKPMSDGLQSNAIFFKLGFLDKNNIALGKQFKELLPVLWMKAGAYGPCPSIEGDALPNMLVYQDNRFAVLLNESSYLEFIQELDKHPEIETVFFVTDSNAGYRDMIIGLEDKHTYQLYRDYLDNFRINTSRR